MDSIFKKVKLRADGNRSAFDRGYQQTFHTPFGALLPCGYWRVCPDDYVELQVESETICDTLVRPAFMRLKEHIDFYFVPFQQLWMPFDNLITGQDNYFSAEIADTQGNSPVPKSVPMFNASFLTKVISGLSGLRDEHGFNAAYGCLRLLDLLDYGCFYQYRSQLSSGDITEINTSNFGDMNFFNMLAYQKIYYDYYRNPKYENNNVKAYNIDNLVGGQVLNGTQASNFYDAFTMHYRWAKKDYFTSVQPNVLADTVNIGFSGLPTDFNNPSNSSAWSYFGVPGSGNSTAGGTQTIAKLAYTGSTVPVPNSGAVIQQSNPVNSQQQAYNSITALRVGFAWDKLLRRMREAGGTFDAQMLAQFGITPFDARHGKCYYLGGQTNRLSASSVTDVSGNGLGQLGGQIHTYNQPKNTFKYHAKEHGIIMAVYSTSLDYSYESYRIARENLASSRFDWYNPIWDKIGLQPIFAQELSFYSQGQGSQPDPAFDDDREINILADNRKLLGYNRRYSEYKTGIDKVHGLFNIGKTMDATFAPWVSPYRPLKYDTTLNKSVFDIPKPLTARFLEFNPAQFDYIANLPYTGEWSTDHFKNNIYLHCKCISNMSPIGENF